MTKYLIFRLFFIPIVALSVMDFFIIIDLIRNNGQYIIDLSVVLLLIVAPIIIVVVLSILAYRYWRRHLK